MSFKTYKWCIVPQCTNTSLKTPEKLFIHVPTAIKERKKWLQLARRDPGTLSTTTSIYICEDHFDLPNDMENYMEYHLMGSVSRIRMKPGVLPTKYECQPDRIKRTATSTITRPLAIKRLKLEHIKDSEKELQAKAVAMQQEQIIASATDYPSTSLPQVEKVESKSITSDKSVQVVIRNTYRSKATQTKILTQNKSVSPLRISTMSSSTSPLFKSSVCIAKPSRSSVRKIFIAEEKSDSDTSSNSYTSSVNSVLLTDSSSSLHSLQDKISSDSSSVTEQELKIKNDRQSELLLQSTISKITKRPRFYIGVPKNCYFLINIIKEHTNIPEEHILLCLKKIRLDTKFSELADEFGLSLSYASKIFLKNVPIIANVLRPFIVKLNTKLTKRNLPMAFRHKFHNVSCIIDCLEIEIQKPSKAINQALTWSDYKKANTLKYLISSTPDGLVNYISPGYGGRISDVCLVENCKFLDSLESGTCVLADRGFKHVDQLLLKMGCQLIRPPSVSTGSKLSKTEVRQTKQIASLRIHIERVIRRLREFSLLKPHACININLIRVIDDVISIACGLINLQDSIIK